MEDTHADLLIGGKDNLGPSAPPDGLSALIAFPSSGKATDNRGSCKPPVVLPALLWKSRNWRIQCVACRDCVHLRKVDN